MNFFINRNRLIENKFMVSKGECRGINQEIGINVYTLQYIKQVTNKDLLYHTRTYTQYFVITYKGKEKKLTFSYGKISQRSGCTQNIPQHNKGHKEQTLIITNREIKKSILLTIASKRIKYLEINVTKDVKEKNSTFTD